VTLVIRSVRVEDEDDALSAAAEFADSGFEWSTTPPNSEMPWAEYVALLREWEQGRSLPEGWVPATTRFAIVDGRVAGRLSVRHELNEFLTLVGGHIGYGVREQFRRQGIATALLAEGLHILRELDLASALVTCKESNVGSATVIERGGGILRDRINHPSTNEVMRRYDIAL
jgi:predicted acetyltransferase